MSKRRVEKGWLQDVKMHRWVADVVRCCIHRRLRNLNFSFMRAWRRSFVGHKCFVAQRVTAYLTPGWRDSSVNLAAKSMCSDVFLLSCKTWSWRWKKRRLQEFRTFRYTREWMSEYALLCNFTVFFNLWRWRTLLPFWDMSSSSHRMVEEEVRKMQIFCWVLVWYGIDDTSP